MIFRTLMGHGQAAPGYEDVSPQQLAALSETAWLVDVRGRAELTDPLGHIAGVRHVPLPEVGAAFADADRSQPIVMICRSGGRSANAARRLVAMGFEKVYNLDGGMMAYNRAGLPVSHDGTLRDVR